MGTHRDRSSAATIGPTAAIKPDAVLRLPAQCTIRDAQQLLAQLQVHIEESSPIYIDAAQVERDSPWTSSTNRPTGIADRLQYPISSSQSR